MPQWPSSRRAIARAAGVTFGAIYSMFDGKDDLCGALLAESLEPLNAHGVTQVTKAKSTDGAGPNLGSRVLHLLR
ncbi:TetR family transcriptional regulator [Falsiruegeria mediterranea]